MVWKFNSFGCSSSVSGGNSLAFFSYWLSVLKICKHLSLESSTNNLVTYMRFIPLAERGGINLDDSTLDKRIGSNEFVVWRIVDLCWLSVVHRVNDTELTYDTDNSCFASNMLRSPCKVATFKTKSTMLYISSSHTYGVNTLRTELGGSWLSA